MQADLRVEAEPWSGEPPTLQPRHPELGRAGPGGLERPPVAAPQAPPPGLSFRPRSPPRKKRDTQKVSEPGGQQRTSRVPEEAWMRGLGRSQRPDRRRQGEVGGLNGPSLQASDLPPGGTRVSQIPPHQTVSASPPRKGGGHGDSGYHHGRGTLDTPAAERARALAGLSRCICLIGGRGRSGSP